MFSFSNGAHEISIEFCVVKFSSFGWILLMDYGTRSGKPKLGNAHGTPKIIQGHQKVKAWGCPGRHPLFRPLPSVTYLQLYFYSPHDMCFAWSILYYLCLCLLVYHNHPFCTYLLRDPCMNWNLLEYSMCFTYIFWAI